MSAFLRKKLRLIGWGLLVSTASLSCDAPSRPQKPSPEKPHANGHQNPDPNQDPKPSLEGDKDPVPLIPEEGALMEFAVPGLQGMVSARVFAEGRMELVKRPLHFETKILVDTQNSARLDDDFCEEIRTKQIPHYLIIKNYPPPLNGYRYNIIRDYYKFILETPLDPFFSTDFSTAAIEAARLKWPQIQEFYLKQTLKISKVRPKLVLAEDALSHTFGKLGELEEMFGGHNVYPNRGIWKGTTWASDLVCDLRSGKAKVEFELEMNGFRFTTTVKGVGEKQ
jgi:hypothetical protein